MKTSNMYEVLAIYNPNSSKKISDTLKKRKISKYYSTNSYTHIECVPGNELNSLIDELRACKCTVNGKDFKVRIYPTKFVQADTKPQKKKKPSNNNKTVAHNAKLRRKASNIAKAQIDRAPHQKQRKSTKSHSRACNMPTATLKKVRKMRKIGKAITNKAERKNPTPLKRNIAKDRQQKLKFAA